MKSPFELSKEEMQNLGYRIVDSIVDHFVTADSSKPVTKATRKEMDDLFLQEAPEDASSADDVLDFVLQNVVTNSNISIHPKSFSFVPGPSNFISVMADNLATGFNIFSGGWMISPAAAELEIVTMNWLLQLFGFPVKKGGGVFTSGGSVANLTGIITARRIKCEDDFSNAIIYLSDQAHSSNIKAIRMLGFTKEQVRLIPTGNDFKLDTSKLKNEVAKDKLLGNNPFCIIATAGTTNTGTVDDLEEIAKICKNNNLWFHIDAAYGGAAVLVKEKNYLKGIELADSVTVDPHKWFFQPYEIGCLLVKDSKWLNNTFSEKPEYLRDIEGNESEINFYDYGIQLTRRFRALKFYMSIKTYGLKAFRQAISYNIKLAEETEEILRKSVFWEVVAPANLAIINFRFNSLHHNLDDETLDKINQQISERVMESREALLVTTVLQNRVVIRMCLINPKTTIEHIKETIAQCEVFGKELLPK
ncbi:aminotransferase class V-fold PLP-dependent enzyme [Polaribacter sp.]|nr:aminotransferase class V-fold PLP-dependent enzyme [Polaribacter sp.]